MFISAMRPLLHYEMVYSPSRSFSCSTNSNNIQSGDGVSVVNPSDLEQLMPSLTSSKTAQSLFRMVRRTGPYRHTEIWPVWYCMSVQLGMLGRTERVCSLYRPIQGGLRTSKPSDRYISPVPGGIGRFLGHFHPQQGKPAIWELDSDQHCNVGRSVHGFVDEYSRFFFNIFCA
ncbi:hypothetical protein B296_00017106 [Ensete ventricosum]|uniref:Uncharacterized protein n=1 Tax=Ensete ventricosum TaxID=4639 RepID=A0A426YL31_ENSVE|nr:hypothetical protein B296_00017106 [Ensete ventricosum]